MDLIKIGTFIAERRKIKKLTQTELAEKLNITDRAVSKWENGKSMPDSGIMLKLCDILEITVNELLNGECIKMENYNEILEKNLLDIVKQKEEADKKLLSLEIIMGVTTIVFFFILVMLASFVEMQEWVRILIIILSTIFVFIVCLLLLRIEQTAGYYECQKCKHKYIPTYSSVLWAMHFGRTRYMKCPECNKKSWNKKVLTK